jgi:hypothetical protein
MRFYRWASSSEGNSGIRELHIKGWADDFELSWRLQEAQPFGEGEWIQEAPAEWDEEGPLTDMPFNPNFHLVSPRLRALLEELGLGAEIQFLPVWVVGEKSGREVGVYYVAHFLQRISCLDLEHSIYCVWSGLDPAGAAGSDCGGLEGGLAAGGHRGGAGVPGGGV